jgi:hypothetical protein
MKMRKEFSLFFLFISIKNFIEFFAKIQIVLIKFNEFCFMKRWYYNCKFCIKNQLEIKFWQNWICYLEIFKRIPDTFICSPKKKENAKQKTNLNFLFLSNFDRISFKLDVFFDDLPMHDEQKGSEKNELFHHFKVTSILCMMMDEQLILIIWNK